MRLLTLEGGSDADTGEPDPVAAVMGKDARQLEDPEVALLIYKNHSKQ